MFRLILIIFSALLPSLAAAETRQFRISGHRVIVVAPDAIGDDPAPLVLALHGGTGNAAQLRKVSGLDSLAHEHGFRVAYVDGSAMGRVGFSHTWNAGRCCGPAVRRGDDNVAMLSQVIEALAPLHRQQPVWITGHSNGGMMAYRMTCERSDLIDGIVPVAGALMLESCGRAQSVSVLHIHGTQDQNVPITGGIGADSRIQMPYPALADSLRQMSQAGANTSQIVVEGAGHKFGELNRMIQRQTGNSVADLIAQAVAQNR